MLHVVSVRMVLSFLIQFLTVRNLLTLFLIRLNVFLLRRILQSAFFRITEVIPVDLAVEQMKKFIVKSYGKKGQDVVDKNYAAVDRGGEYQKLAIDPAWVNLPDDAI